MQFCNFAQISKSVWKHASFRWQEIRGGMQYFVQLAVFSGCSESHVCSFVRSWFNWQLQKNVVNFPTIVEVARSRKIFWQTIIILLYIILYYKRSGKPSNESNVEQEASDTQNRGHEPGTNKAKQMNGSTQAAERVKDSRKQQEGHDSRSMKKAKVDGRRDGLQRKRLRELLADDIDRNNEKQKKLAEQWKRRSEESCKNKCTELQRPAGTNKDALKSILNKIGKQGKHYMKEKFELTNSQAQRQSEDEGHQGVRHDEASSAANMGAR